MNGTETLAPARMPTVYFIDDSATMREVIKIAFRKENIQVVTCADAASALAQFDALAPDVVITDVIMPDKDGYQVCQFVKEHERLARTPVILMSGVVNKSVAEKAMAVKADELIRKPFQPQDLIARVKNLLRPKSDGNGGKPSPAADPAPGAAARVLSSLFSAPPVSASPPAPTGAFAPRAAPPVPVHSAPAAPASGDVQKLRNEIRRFELLVRKLQAELEAERQYCAALEADFKAAQEAS